ncbi:MAG: ABC transporter ATP-binding protein [Bacteroidetes bacterium]|nr:ABC transporter ATP-binding protein [Bacteroidota bacterium]MBU1422584.1 ABC transporter ATP-binding protein [Bacteroidota bacterium]MBU2471378.1 ABC transporter ATP-binding protein [Bacteroidota bacterium]MBU2635879.1 ABC transporter ATP-binding protein [Bacteroidota bacterium]
MSEPILQTHNLSKRFKKRFAVSELNIEVERSDVFGFLGPNGAGKSTTIRMLLSLINPTSGKITLFGKNLHKHRGELLKRIGGLVEKPDFYGHLSAYDNLKFIGSLYGGVSRSRIEEVLDIVKLKDRMYDKVKTYSHGMKQRLGIAQALIGNPELIILDEPTSGLDPQGMKEVRELIRTLSSEHNITIFLSSHLLYEIELVSNRMAIINKGKLVIQGDVQELLNSGEHRVQIKAEPHEKAEQVIKSLPSVHLVDGTENRNGVIVVYTPFDNIPALNKVLVDNGVSVSAIIPRRSLEDYFLEMTEGASDV